MKKGTPVFALAGLIVIVILGTVGWMYLTQPDRRTAGQKIGDAIDALPQGLDHAINQLEDRTPGQRIGDVIKDAGESIKKNTGNE